MFAIAFPSLAAVTSLTSLTFLAYGIAANECVTGEASAPNLTVSDHNALLAKTDHYVDVEVDGTLRLKCDGREPIVWHSTDFDLVNHFWPLS